MNPTPKILAALALGLITSVFPVSAQVAASAVTKITSLPFNVPVTGGTFVLTSDLTCSMSQSTAIAIPSNITASVLLDLKGHTITGGGILSTGIGIGGAFGGPAVANAFPITVRNGAIQNVSFGVWAESSQLATVLSGITIGDLTLTMVQPPAANSTCVLFGGYVENSIVRNCTFNHSTYGVQDILSPGGNRFNNISMNSIGDPLLISASQAAPVLVLETCEFAPPPVSAAAAAN